MICIRKQAKELQRGDLWQPTPHVRIERVSHNLNTGKVTFFWRYIGDTTSEPQPSMELNENAFVETLHPSAFILCKVIDREECYLAGSWDGGWWSRVKSNALMVARPPLDLKHISMTDDETYWMEIFSAP